VPNAVIICVGASREDQRNQRIADSAFRDRVLLLPRQPRDRMAAFTGLASVLVSPRSHGSNFPLKIFDYLAAGKPIVATDVPAHRAVLDDTLALLVPSTAAGMADGLIEVLRNRELAERLGAAGADYARLHLTWPSFVRSISEIYGEAEAHRTLRKATTANPHKVGAC
jgi:glycosyltransferase involved in cell wall biosynthesis